MNGETVAGPLAGIRVFDASALLPGPYATRLLADLGADVIKLERPQGDEIQTMLPGVYEFLNRGKRVVRADLKSDDGCTLATRLLGWADVVLESFRPGVADRLGVGFDDAVRSNPAVVYCSISGFGQSGPRRMEPGHDMLYQAAAGAFAGPLAAGDPVARPHLPLGDLGSATFAALTITATVRDPSRTGAVRLDVSMHEVVTYYAVTRWGELLTRGTPPAFDQLGNYSPGHRVYRTYDGRQVTLAAVEDRFWHRLCEVLERPDLTRTPYDTHAGRMVHRVHLEDALESTIGALDSAELLPRLLEADVPASLVTHPRDVLEDAHLRDRGALTDLGGQTLLQFPVLSDGHRGWSATTHPDHEADLDSVLADLNAES